MSTQTTMELKVKQRIIIKPSKKRIKRADEFKLLPLADCQLDWAMGHNLQWVLSLIKPGEGQVAQ
jgi:hypothetical protein